MVLRWLAGIPGTSQLVAPRLPGTPGAFQVAPRGQVAPRSQGFLHPKGSQVAPKSSWGLTGAFQGKISLNDETMACWLMHED